MARISGIDLPRDKRVEVGLTYIYGIGLHTSQQLLQRTGINPDTRIRELTEDEVQRLRDLIDKEFRVEGDLRREISMNIKRLMDIGCYRGFDIGVACRFADSGPERTPERVAVPSGRLVLRRRNRLWASDVDACAFGVNSAER